MFCFNCGQPVPDGGQFCPKCGTAVVAIGSLPTRSQIHPETKSESDQRGARLVITLGVVVLIIIATIAFMFSTNTPSSVPPKSSIDNHSAVPSEPVAPRAEKRMRHTGNAAQDMLIAYTESEQAAFLGMAVGEGCVGTQAFFMGMDHKNDAFWSLRCADGQSYGVEIHPDSTGSTQVLECSILKAVAGTDCFTKFKN